MRRMGWVAVVLLVALPAAGTGAPARKPASRSATPTAPAAPKRIANPPGLIAFYPRVAARVQKPPAESSLRVLTETTVEDGSHIAFVSYGRRLSILAVFTRQKFKKPEEALFLAPRYVVAKDMKAVSEGREPLVSATAGEVTDWTYVYDRNGDGHADYLAYLVGPLPVMPDSFPADFPPDEATLTYGQLDYKLDHERYVFTHVADEDFDGTVDAIVLYVRDPARDWVKNYAAIMSLGSVGPDTAWTFHDAIESPTGTLPAVRGGFLRHRNEGRDVVVTAANFTGWTNILARINAAADSTKARFPNSP